MYSLKLFKFREKPMEELKENKAHIPFKVQSLQKDLFFFKPFG